MCNEPLYSIKAGLFETNILVHALFESIEYISEFRIYEALTDRNYECEWIGSARPENTRY
jgi:hypothetical protein